MMAAFIGNLLEAVRWFLLMAPALAALFLALLFLVTLLQVRFPEERVRGLLQRRSALTRYLGGALLGTVTPFCSMTTIPVLIGLLQRGAPFGPTMAFLISSPLLDGVVLGVLTFLIGPKLTVLYAALTFLASMGLGALFARLGFEADLKNLKQAPLSPAPIAGGAADSERERVPAQVRGMSGGGAERVPGSWAAWRRVWSRARQAGSMAWRAFVPLVPHLVVATAIAATGRAFLPIDWVLTIAGPNQPLVIPLMAALGLPLYINAEILLPVTAALLDKGIGPGAVVALVIAGLGMSASEVVLLMGFFRLRLIVALVLSFFAVAVGGGALAGLVAG
jgi:uncharacterized membrane protein YraQ (UPF0718 family)